MIVNAARGVVFRAFGIGPAALLLFAALSATLYSHLAVPAVAAETEKAKTAAKSAPIPADAKVYDIVYIRESLDRPPPLSFLDLVPEGVGYAGAELAIDDNNTTGRFLKQAFILSKIESSKQDELVSALNEQIAKGVSYFIVDASADTLLALSAAAKGKPAILFNVRATDNRLREEQCQANIMHTAPSRNMLTDAVTQYLVWKRWSRLLLIKGPQAEDELYAAAFRRSAKRFGLKIVQEFVFEYEVGSRRADGGFEQVQQQIPQFTQKAPDYDVAIIADEWDQFGGYFQYRTWKARPVAGTHGLYSNSWHPAIEMWGGTQFQNRFIRKTNRRMRDIDYNAWMAVRTVGEAATRRQKADAAGLISYIRSTDFELAAFKGTKLTYRDWNGQLRQPVLLTTGKLLVSVSPQTGFLHQLTELDTLGADKPETKCKAYTQ